MSDQKPYHLFPAPPECATPDSDRIVFFYFPAQWDTRSESAASARERLMDEFHAALDQFFTDYAATAPKET